MKPSADIRDALARIGTLPDESVDVAETALLLASIQRPGVSLGPYRRHMERMTAEVTSYVAGHAGGADLDLRAEALTQVIAKRYGYGGADETDGGPENVNLMWVIDRRRGLPAALGVLYIHAARRNGWDAQGIGFPSGFLLRMEQGGRRLILDPFDNGRILAPNEMRDMLKAVSGIRAELTPDHFQPVANRNVLLRIQHNIKERLLMTERPGEALDTIEATLLFAPDTTRLWREAGLLHARLENIPEAISALEEFMRRNKSDKDRYRTSVILQDLRTRLN